MPRFLSLAEAVEDCVRDGDTETPKPTANALAVLRDLHVRTARAHGTAA